MLSGAPARADDSPADVVRKFFSILLPSLARSAQGVAFFLALLFVCSVAIPSVHASLLNPSSIGFSGQTRSANYDALVDALYTSGNVTTTIGDKLWVPWFSSSSACGVSNLQSGGACNSGETIDFTHNCMVTDEFSQVGILVAMGSDQARMDQFYNTVLAINSSRGQLPAWRVYRSGNTIQQCRSGINGNCDTASDATARIIIALYTAADNSRFANAARKSLYRELANNLSAQFLQYEVLNSCKASSLGHGYICWWMAAGSGAKSGGMGSTDFGYTGYYADGIIAMLQACGQTQNATYCAVAGNFTLNYLQAAQWDGSSFRAPPGRSFKWTNLDDVPVATCTASCSPAQWDDADAPRAFGMCQALPYAETVGVTLPGLATYCEQWRARHLTNTNSAPIQYAPDGVGASSQSGYFAQGLQALHAFGANTASFATILDNALSHYTTSKKTWDYAACFGVYHQAFPVRALGSGIGRDAASFREFTGAAQDGDNPTNGTNQTNTTANPAPTSIGFLWTSPASPTTAAEPENKTFSYALTNPSGQSTSSIWYVGAQSVAYNTTNYTFRGNYTAAGTYNVTVLVSAATNSLIKEWVLTVTNTPIPANTTNGTVNVTTNATTNTTNVTGDVPGEQSPAGDAQDAVQDAVGAGSGADESPSAPATESPAQLDGAAGDAAGGAASGGSSAGGSGSSGGGGSSKKRLPGDPEIQQVITSYFVGTAPVEDLISQLRAYYGVDG
jgi:uncharacterized membrane protein YgcG